MGFLPVGEWYWPLHEFFSLFSSYGLSGGSLLLFCCDLPLWGLCFVLGIGYGWPFPSVREVGSSCGLAVL